MIEPLEHCPWCGGEVSITYNSFDKAFAVWHKGKPCKFIEPLWIEGEDIKSLADAYRFWNSWRRKIKT